MLELLLAALSKLLQEILQARHLLAILISVALTEQPLQRSQQVALLEQIVAHRVQKRLGVQVQDML